MAETSGPPLLQKEFYHTGPCLLQPQLFIQQRAGLIQWLTEECPQSRFERSHLIHFTALIGCKCIQLHPVCRSVLAHNTQIKRQSRQCWSNTNLDFTPACLFLTLDVLETYFSQLFSCLAVCDQAAIFSSLKMEEELPLIECVAQR